MGSSVCYSTEAVVVGIDVVLRGKDEALAAAHTF